APSHSPAASWSASKASLQLASASPMCAPGPSRRSRRGRPMIASPRGDPAGPGRPFFRLAGGRGGPSSVSCGRCGWGGGKRLRSDRVGEAKATPAVDGTVEYFSWSPDGRAILLGVAGLGAELAGAQGSGRTSGTAEELPAWIPAVDSGAADDQWRRIWIYDQ